MESVNKITLNKQNMHTLKRSTCRGSARVTASRQDTCEPPPRQDPVPRPARTFCGTGWTFAKDCGTASPGLETPDVKWGVGGVQKNREEEIRQSKLRILIMVLKRAQLTSTSSRCDRCSALVCLIQFPALVTNTTGTLYFPLRSTRFLKHCLAAGISVLPRTSTPSMSKRSPKELGPWGESGGMCSVKTPGYSLTEPSGRHISRHLTHWEQQTETLFPEYINGTLQSVTGQDNSLMNEPRWIR